MGPIIVISLRLLLPLLMFRYRIVGALVAMVADAFDVILITLINKGEFTSYPAKDKYLDMYYLGIEMYLAWSWKNVLARKTGGILFLWRVAGFVLFEVTQVRALLFFFPNLFENFYLFYIVSLKVLKKDIVTSKKNLIFILLVLLVPKLSQEYFLHVYEAQPWKWFRFHVLGMNR